MAVERRMDLSKHRYTEERWNKELEAYVQYLTDIFEPYLVDPWHFKKGLREGASEDAKEAFAIVSPYFWPEFNSWDEFFQ